MQAQRKIMDNQMKKLKLVYDATCIRNGIWKNGHRGGVFIVALNLLKEFLKRKDIDLLLYCDPLAYHELKYTLDKEISDYKFTIKTDKAVSWYGKLRMMKREFKKEQKNFQKTLVHILLLILYPFMKLISLVSHKDSFEKYDAFLSPIFFINEKISTKNKYIVLHDIIPLSFSEYCSHVNDWQWFCDLCKSLNSRDSYFAVSEHTKIDFLNNFSQIDPNKIKTILLGYDKRFKPNKGLVVSIKTKYGIPQDKKYIFSLCSLAPHKNLIRAIKTFVEFLKKNNIDDLIFVMGGGNWPKFFKKLENEIDNLRDYSSKIIHIGYVDDDDLSTLYSSAEWFVYTSAYEGFGLPPLEAMACGCPVIVSNNSSLPEVVGEAGIQIDWNIDDQHIQAYEQYYFNPKLREENSKKGLERAKQFSWEKCADLMIETMKEALLLYFILM